MEGYADGQRVFSNRTSLIYTAKSISVFIQTDKSTYKPGQDVMFRIVTVYPDLKPYKASLNIYIRVSIRGNLMVHWNLSYIPTLHAKHRLYVLLPKSC